MEYILDLWWSILAAIIPFLFKKYVSLLVRYIKHYRISSRSFNISITFVEGKLMFRGHLFTTCDNFYKYNPKMLTSKRESHWKLMHTLALWLRQVNHHLIWFCEKFDILLEFANLFLSINCFLQTILIVFFKQY